MLKTFLLSVLLLFSTEVMAQETAGPMNLPWKVDNVVGALRNDPHIISKAIPITGLRRPMRIRATSGAEIMVQGTPAQARLKDKADRGNSLISLGDQADVKNGQVIYLSVPAPYNYDETTIVNLEGEEGRLLNWSVKTTEAPVHTGYQFQINQGVDGGEPLLVSYEITFNDSISPETDVAISDYRDECGIRSFSYGEKSVSLEFEDVTTQNCRASFIVYTNKNYKVLDKITSAKCSITIKSGSRAATCGPYLKKLYDYVEEDVNWEQKINTTDSSGIQYTPRVSTITADQSPMTQNIQLRGSARFGRVTHPAPLVDSTVFLERFRFMLKIGKPDKVYE